MRRWKLLWWVPLVTVLLTAPGCSRQAGVQASSPDFSGAQHLPFEQESDKGGISPTASLAFTEIPGGASITVRIQSVVSSASAHPGDTFQAVLDSPIMVQGQTLAARGCPVAGLVIAAKAASAANEAGYLRLTLTAISIAGKTIPLQTASTFVKGLAAPGLSSVPAGSVGRASASKPFATKDVEFPAERRLTFRLTQSFSAQD